MNTQGYSDTVGSLTLASSSTIDLGTGGGNSIWTFADSSAASWIGILQIWNWSGQLSGSGTDQLYFGVSGLTPGQIAQINFVDPAGLPSGTYGAQLLGSGELVPVPEPAALGMCGILLTMAMVRRRKSAAE